MELQSEKGQIKPILDIHEYSLYYFLGLSFLALLLASGLIYLIFKWVKAKKAFNIRREHLKIIKSLNLSDTKHTAYTMTLLGFTFKDDSPKHSEMYATLIQRLEEYKYKKEVDTFDSEVLDSIKVYKGMLNV